MATIATPRRPAGQRSRKAPARPPEASPAERAAAGRALRADVPRSSHAELPPRHSRTDPIAMLETQAKTRVPELVPERYSRMAASAFTFYRGGAFIMAADLARSPTTGLRVQLCGDAALLQAIADGRIAAEGGT